MDCDIDRVLKTTAFKKINRRRIEIVYFKQFFMPFKIGVLVVHLNFSVMFMCQGTTLTIILFSGKSAHSE